MAHPSMAPTGIQGILVDVDVVVDVDVDEQTTAIDTFW